MPVVLAQLLTALSTGNLLGSSRDPFARATATYLHRESWALKFSVRAGPWKSMEMHVNPKKQFAGSQTESQQSPWGVVPCWTAGAALWNLHQDNSLHQTDENSGCFQLTLMSVTTHFHICYFKLDLHIQITVKAINGFGADWPEGLRWYCSSGTRGHSCWQLTAILCV